MSSSREENVYMAKLAEEIRHGCSSIAYGASEEIGSFWIGLNQEGDEVELDFEALDVETLRELDRFVSSFRKSMGKFRRQEATIPVAPRSLSVPAEDDNQNQSPLAEAKKIKKSEPVDDVVDIGDDLPIGNYPSIEIEKDNAVGGYASSFDSDSSSSTTGSSDLDSSSGRSNFEDDDGRNPAVCPRSSP